MSNKIEILVEVDPYGRGAARIKSIGVGVDGLTAKTNKAGAAGKDALSGFGGGLGIPTNIAAASAALAGGILLVANAAKKAALENANAQRILKSDSQEAGIAFGAAQMEARRFGEDLALSNTQATVSFSQFIRVVKAAGLTENLSKYRQSFTDLAAAYGLQAGEITTLVSQLISGQDEALNRLGIADPSALYKKYAANVGKVVEELTEEEKVRARLLAVTEKGEKFAGVAAERLAGEVGQWANLDKAIADATANLGKWFITSAVGRQTPSFIQAIGKNPMAAILGVFGSGELMTSMQAENSLMEEAKQRASNAARLNKAVLESLRQEALLSGKGLTADLGAEMGGAVAQTEAEKAASKVAQAFAAQFAATLKDGKLDPVTAIFAERNLNAVKGGLSPEKFKEIQAGLNKFWENYAKTALTALKTARDAAEANFASLAARSAGDGNPFVKILTDAEERAKDLRRTFGVLKDSVVEGMLEAENAYNRQKLLGLQLDQDLKANALRREADSLAGFSGVTGAEQRRLNTIDAQVSAAESIPSLLAKAEAISRGLIQLQEGQFDKTGKRLNPKEALRYELGGQGQDKVNSAIFDELTRINTGGFEFGSQAGRQAQDAVNAALVNLFNSMAPDMQARIASGQEGANKRRTFADAFTGQAGSFRDAVKEEIAKAAVADKAVSNVREDMAKIEAARRQGLSDKEADARLLVTTGELAPGEMTADIRQARIEALRREADRTVKAQADATKAVTDATAATNKLIESIDNLARDSRNPENRKLLIEVNNRAKADVRSELYGSLSPDGG